MTFHDLRATAITKMPRAGLKESEVMKISGHAKYSTFMKYVRQDKAGAKPSADKMDDYLSGKQVDFLELRGTTLEVTKRRFTY